MNVRYKREMRHNYLILEALEDNSESFEIRMLAVNSIEGVLKFRVKQEEEQAYYYYEITSKQPLSRLLEFKEIKREEIGSLITGIGSVLNRIESYLLQEANVLLEPEYIYIEPESFQVWLCYVPGYGGNFPAAMEKLLQFLLKKADHQDNDTVVLAYRLYQESQKDYYGMDDLLRAVQESQRKNNPKGESEKGQQDFRQDLRRKHRKQQKTTEDDWISEEEDFQEKEKEEEKVWKSGSFPKDEFLENADLEIYRIQQIAEPDGYLRKKQRRLKSENKEKQRKNRNREEKNVSKFAILPMIVLAIACPAAAWFLAGEAWIRCFGRELIAAEGIILVVYMLFLRRKNWRSVFMRKSGNRQGKGLRKRESGKKEVEQDFLETEWYMTFDQEEEEDEEEKTESCGDFGWERENKRQRVQEGYQEQESGEEVFVVGGKCKDTMLLAEMEPSQKKQHLLKSLDSSVEDIPVSYFPFIIGKQEGIVDYVLKRPTVSRLHIRIDQEEEDYKITDLNSSNGTVVAGRNLEANESCPINSGDKIQIADLSFVFY